MRCPSSPRSPGARSEPRLCCPLAGGLWLSDRLPRSWHGISSSACTRTLRNARMLVASAMAVATLALSATQSSAQQPAARPIGEAHLLPGAEWAIGQWEGNVQTVGTSASSMGLLTIEKDAAGNFSCRFVTVPPPASPHAGLTKRCVIKPNGISLTTAISTEIELTRSGPDGLQGGSKSSNARGVQAPSVGGIQVYLNRVR